jgi:glycosyltransferase involved in cell wall biosynthesis
MVEIIAAFTGLGLFAWRLRERRPLEVSRHPPKFQELTNDASPTLKDLSILIPARNEAHNLPYLLESLSPAQKEGVTILVIDDQSTDGTGDIGERFGIMTYRTDPKPDGWSGKNWACQQGYDHLKNQQKMTKYILFTDADTTHHPEAVKTSLEWLHKCAADVLTARPYHRNPQFWEQLLGPFYLLISFITNAKNPHPSPQRFFSIGQYLLFRSDAYEAIGGHQAIRTELAEDLAIAKNCFLRGQKFVVHPNADLYTTRMYASKDAFFGGWQRNFRLGLKQTHWLTAVEVILVIGALMKPPTFWHYSLGAFLMGWFQTKEGRFHWLGALLYPISLMAFILVSLTAIITSTQRKPIYWKAREYEQ